MDKNRELQRSEQAPTDTGALCDITKLAAFHTTFLKSGEGSRRGLVWCLSCEPCNPCVTRNHHFSSALPMARDPQPAGGAVQVLGAAVGVPHPAAAGPAGVLPSQGGDRAGVLTQLGQAGREVLLQDPQLQGAPTVQVSRPRRCRCSPACAAKAGAPRGFVQNKYEQLPGRSSL